MGVIYGADSEENPFVVAEEIEAASLHVQKELASREFLAKLGSWGWMLSFGRLTNYRYGSFASLGVQGIMTDFPERFWKLTISQETFYATENSLLLTQIESWR